MIFYLFRLLLTWKSYPLNSASLVIKFVFIFLNPDVKHLIAFLQSLAANKKFIILVGNFNLPDTCWLSLTGYLLFCDFVFESNLAQLITCPTHVRGNILDILLTICDHLISSISLTKPNDCSTSSDYYIISFLIECSS